MREEIIQKRNYDSAIHGDELSLKIASYPATARYLAERLAPYGDSICELCCGIGVSLVEFSRHFETVVGIDNDLSVADAARQNLQQVGVTNCEVLVGSVENADLLRGVSTDIVAYDIPYWSDHGGTVKSKNPDLKEILALISAHMSTKIVVYTPPHVSYEDIAKIADTFEYQEVWVGDKYDRNFIYFGDLIQMTGLSKIVLA